MELPLCDTEITHLVEAHRYSAEGEWLKWLRLQSINKMARADTNGEMRMIVDPGAGSHEVVDIVNGGLADGCAVGARCEGVGCARLQ
jgi:hypothetical protein